MTLGASVSLVNKTNKNKQKSQEFQSKIPAFFILNIIEPEDKYQK